MADGSSGDATDDSSGGTADGVPGGVAKCECVLERRWSTVGVLDDEGCVTLQILEFPSKVRDPCPSLEVGLYREAIL